MSLLLDGLRGIQVPQIVHRPPGVVNHLPGAEAAELAESAGLVLDESQRFTLEVALGERADGKWAAFEVCDVEPRQSGKSETAIARELAGLFVFGERLQIHTAHEFPTATEAFLRIIDLITNDSQLKAKVSRFRYGAGEQAVELKSGARLKYKARTGGGGRGFAGADLVVYDEAMYLLAAHIGASLPTLSRGRNPQAWYAASAGLPTSTLLWALRKRALSGEGGRLAYVEHTAEVCEMVDGVFKSNRDEIDPRDRHNWAMANPALGAPEHGISVEYVENELGAMASEIRLFLRERLGVWDPLAEDAIGESSPIPDGLWTAGTVVPVVDPARWVLAFAVGHGGEASSIALGCGFPGGGEYVELVDHRRGVLWLAERVAQLVVDRNPVAVGFDPSGPSGAVVPDLRDALRRRGVEWDDVVRPVSGRDYAGACAGLVEAVAGGGLKHPDQPEMTRAVKAASKRDVGDVWVWRRKDQSVPIAPLEAVTVARALWLTVPAVVEASAFAIVL